VVAARHRDGDSTLKVSIADFPRLWDESEDDALINGVIEHSLAADALGFDGIFFPEHHFRGIRQLAAMPSVGRVSRTAAQARLAWNSRRRRAICTTLCTWWCR